MALRKKITNCRGLQDFRTNLDVKVKQKYELRPIGSKDIIRSFSESRFFGKGNKPETPIKTLINGEYGNQTEQLYEDKARKAQVSLTQTHFLDEIPQKVNRTKGHTRTYLSDVGNEKQIP